MPGRFGPKDKLRITFTLNEKDAATGEPITVTALVTASTNEKSTLHRFIVALTGKNPPDTFDPESLTGTSCRVKTAQRANGKGQVFSNVVDLEALRPN